MMRHPRLTIRETIMIPTLKGIFFHLADSGVFEFLDSDVARTLNVDYYEVYSRDKIASPLYQNQKDALIYVDDGDLVLVDGDYVGITSNIDDILAEQSKIIIQRFADKWKRIFDVLILEEYNPLENYNMREVELPNITHTRDTKTNTKLKTTQDGDKYGFNSSTASPHDKMVTEVEGDDLHNNINDVDKETGSRTLTRSGNIGVTTSQQMLESEMKIRALYNMTTIIYNDVDSVLTIPLYR